jgi:hypothetical protein
LSGISLRQRTLRGVDKYRRDKREEYSWIKKS